MFARSPKKKQEAEEQDKQLDAAMQRLDTALEKVKKDGREGSTPTGAFSPQKIKETRRKLIALRDQVFEELGKKPQDPMGPGILRKA